MIDDDYCDITSAVVYFREAMDEYMEMKSEILRLYIEIESTPVEELKIGDEMTDRIHMELDLDKKRDKLIGKRVEASRRFGLYFFLSLSTGNGGHKETCVVHAKKGALLNY